MNDKEPNTPDTQMPEMSVNDYGRTKDPAVVVDEVERTVLLTPDETVIIEKEAQFDIVPKNRPRTVYGGMWGRNEIATFSIGVMALLLVAIIYFFLVVSSNRELERHKAEFERLKIEQDTASTLWNDNTSMESRVSKLLRSEEDFEVRYLPAVGSGRNALYQKLNGLIAAYGLINTAGPDYAPLETISDVSRQEGSGDERGRDKYRSLFPGIYVTMTVDGSYANLRRFIRDLEAGQEFVVITTVQLEPSDNENEQRQAAPTEQQQQVGVSQTGYPTRGQGGMMSQPAPVDNFRRPKGKTHGEIVSLHLEMAAYFRRPDFATATATEPQQ